MKGSVVAVLVTALEIVAHRDLRRRIRSRWAADCEGNRQARRYERELLLVRLVPPCHEVGEARKGDVGQHKAFLIKRGGHLTRPKGERPAAPAAHQHFYIGLCWVSGRRHRLARAAPCVERRCASRPAAGVDSIPVVEYDAN